MKQEQLNHYQQLLFAKRDELEHEIMLLETPPAHENVPGDEDETDESTQYFNATASAIDLRKELGNIEHALLKIEKGGYGVCEATGNDIPVEVLEVNPAALYHPEYQKDINK